MRRKSVYVSKLDPKLKKATRVVKSKKNAAPKGLEFEYERCHTEGKHFCDSCEFPE